MLPRARPLSVEGAREVLDYGGARRPAGPVCSPLVASSRLRRTGRSLVGLQLPACLAAARHLSGWRAVPVRQGSGMCEGSSRRFSRAGRNRGSDAGAVRPPHAWNWEAQRRSPVGSSASLSGTGAREAGDDVGWGAARARAHGGGRTVPELHRLGPCVWGPEGRCRAGPRAAERCESRSCGRLPQGLSPLAWAGPDVLSSGWISQPVQASCSCRQVSLRKQCPITRLLSMFVPVPTCSMKID